MVISKQTLKRRLARTPINTKSVLIIAAGSLLALPAPSTASLLSAFNFLHLATEAAVMLR